VSTVLTVAIPKATTAKNDWHNGHHILQEWISEHNLQIPRFMWPNIENTDSLATGTLDELKEEIANVEEIRRLLEADYWKTIRAYTDVTNEHEQMEKDLVEVYIDPDHHDKRSKKLELFTLFFGTERLVGILEEKQDCLSHYQDAARRYLAKAKRIAKAKASKARPDPTQTT
jgi:hypothetical protein